MSNWVFFAINVYLLMCAARGFYRNARNAEHIVKMHALAKQQADTNARNAEFNVINAKQNFAALEVVQNLQRIRTNK